MDQVFQAGQGSGKSGSFFFFSHDRKFIIKTIKSDEKKIYLNKLGRFGDHLNTTNKNSLLGKIFGVFSVQTKYMAMVTVLLMENVTQYKNPNRLRYLFDLKGSMVNRETTGKIKSSTTLKDKNFLALKRKHPGLVNLKPQDKAKIRESIRRDSKFLCDAGLMDYSLLLAIEEAPLVQDRLLDSRSSINDGSRDSVPAPLLGGELDLRMPDRFSVKELDLERRMSKRRSIYETAQTKTFKQFS